ncbi:Golgi apparatus membrane protein TVP23 [Suhomyces tanzawaensis NRRL Y-17324]|uniref:Golgi apparatus membrane protein TVP23 n=1 Tax=Suhomyces tanzawaensis NRRL Y-17324 TaxID=984487 RepID=A0A1E4SLM0_9ASCO|nr:Golgi apparatus membrane protein TVP23 [Suhomyces tanzawaensis NRRL Y-17324]ODV80421.1 Golgi apparatus membrane protein TVP23 [Suhomyces tanzawaensis NRRL Y-17324]
MSGYTQIEPDTEPVNHIEPDVPHSRDQTSHPTGTIASDPNTSTNAQTWAERLKESSHPVALLFYMFFRIAPIVIYIFGNFFLGFVVHKNKFVLHFIILILLVSADFWTLKNVAGRLLVGLRWWNETNVIEGRAGEFENVWVFESLSPDRVVNPIDSKVFWALLYAQPVAWAVLGFLAVLKFEFLYLLLVVMAVSLSVTNAMAFTKCDKFGKANNIASGLLSGATSTVFSRFNPFASA